LGLWRPVPAGSSGVNTEVRNVIAIVARDERGGGFGTTPVRCWVEVKGKSTKHKAPASSQFTKIKCHYACPESPGCCAFHAGVMCHAQQNGGLICVVGLRAAQKLNNRAYFWFAGFWLWLRTSLRRFLRWRPIAQRPGHATCSSRLRFATKSRAPIRSTHLFTPMGTAQRRQIE
jgi:hypothetical protein